MKKFFIKNDKTTYKDELILILFVAVAVIIGILLIVLKPRFWIVTESVSLFTGVFMLFIAAMYIPCIIYRLFQNDKKKK